MNDWTSPRLKTWEWWKTRALKISKGQDRREGKCGRGGERVRVGLHVRRDR